MKTPIIEGISLPGLVSYLNARQYEALYWPSFFPLKNVNTLDGKTLIGSVGSRIAASVISYDAKAPQASRKSMDTKFFDIPKIAVSRVKTEKEILEHQVTKALRGQDAVIEDYFNDVDYVYDSVMGRIEWLTLTALSKTKIQLSTTNNPQGIVNETVVNFGMPTANKKVATTATWTTGHASTMTPITDIKAVVSAGRALGITFQKILMHPDMFDVMTASTEFTNAAKSLLIGESLVLGMMGLETVNKILTSLRLPPIALIETSIGIEGKDGTVTETNPWDQNHLLFIPTTILGDLYNGPIAEEIEKPLDVIQAKRSNVLVSMKKNFDPVNVVTKGEANCFPSWPSVDRCMSLYVASTSTWA